MIGKRTDDDIFSHWAWALPILLLVAVLSIRQIDLYPPTSDEIHSSMNSAGWLTDSSYSPLDVIEDVHRYRPEHVPGYFIILNIWGSLTTRDISMGKTLGVFFGLLSLAMAYRLARDIVAPVAGLFALIIVASNAFFNFYLAHMRMYSLLVLTSGLVLWLYLHIVYRARIVNTKYYLALSAAVFALISTHIFSALLLLALGVYHLIFIPKNGRWLRVSIAVAVAIFVFSPFLFGTAARGIPRTVDVWGGARAGALQVIELWIAVTCNNQLSLLLLSFGGLALGAWKKRIRLQPYLLILPLFLMGLSIMAESTSLVSKYGMRYHLAGWIPLVLVLAAGLYSYFSVRKWLGLIAFLWVVAGLTFQTAADWREYLATGRITPFSLPAYHAVSRLAIQDGQRPHIVGLPYHPRTLNYGYSGRTNQEHYFDQHGISVELIGNSEPEVLADHLRWNARFESVFWLFYQTSRVDPQQVAELDTTIETLHYRHCESVDLGADTVVRRYSWITVDCETPRTAANHKSQFLDYEFYAAELAESESRLYFSDSWTAAQPNSLHDYQMSYQLISPEWENVAQLDLPLVHEGKPRIFFIDVENVPAGSYRLMATLYDVDSGQRVSWLETDANPPDYLPIADVTVSSQD